MIHKKMILKFEASSQLDVMKKLDTLCTSISSVYRNTLKLDVNVSYIDVTDGAVAIIEVFSDTDDDIVCVLDMSACACCLEVNMSNSNLLLYQALLNVKLELDVSLAELELCYVKVKNKSRRSVLFSRVANMLCIYLKLNYFDACQVIDLLSN